MHSTARQDGDGGANNSAREQASDVSPWRSRERLQSGTNYYPGSQASSRGEAKDSALLSSRDAGLLEPPERPQGCCCCCYVTSVVSDFVPRHRRQPTRLPHPWDSPGKNTGVGCHFLLQCMKMKSESEVAQSCPTLFFWNPLAFSMIQQILAI